MNTYGYVRGNPIKFIDSTGLFGTPESIFRDILDFDTGGKFSRRAKKVENMCTINNQEKQCIIRCMKLTVSQEILGQFLIPTFDEVQKDMGNLAKLKTSALSKIIKIGGHISTAISAYQLSIGCMLDCNR